jgi:hypothetical protein
MLKTTVERESPCLMPVVVMKLSESLFWSLTLLYVASSVILVRLIRLDGIPNSAIAS